MDHIIDSNILYEGKVVTLKIDKIQLGEGETVKREIISHPGSVGIVAMSDSGKVVMVKQYRYAIDRELLEVPAGTLERGENPYTCALRELTEETGYIAQKLFELSSIYLAPGYCNEKMHIFLATKLSKGLQHTDLDEKIEVELLDLDDLVKAIYDGRIIDAKSIAAIFLAQRSFKEHST